MSSLSESKVESILRAHFQELYDSDIDPEVVENVDVEVTGEDGSRWTVRVNARHIARTKGQVYRFDQNGYQGEYQVEHSGMGGSYELLVQFT